MGSRRLPELVNLMFDQFNRQIDGDKPLGDTLSEYRCIVDAMQPPNALTAEEEMRRTQTGRTVTVQHSESALCATYSSRLRIAAVRMSSGMIAALKPLRAI